MLAVICGGALFYVSQRTRDANDEISHIASGIAQEQDSIRVLKAEWSYLNRPERLEKLANKYLKIDKTRPYQFVLIDDVKVASNIVTDLPEFKDNSVKSSKPTMVAESKYVSNIEPAAGDVAEVKTFKSKIENLLDDSEENAKPEVAVKPVSKRYKNMAFRSMIKAWGNE